MPLGTVATFDVDAYNALPDLTKADQDIRQRKAEFDKFVAEASKVLARTRFRNGEIGAFLLHRHWTLEPGRVMVERPRVLESGKVALITAPIDAASATDVAPSRWVVPSAAGNMVPLEFSPDPFVLEVNKALGKSASLVTSLAKLVHKHSLQSIIGYMVIPRKSLKLRALEDLVETNAEKVSVVMGERLSAIARKQRIKTGWPLSPTRRGSVWRCCYCSHGPDHTCKHPMPDPPVCKPHGCV